MEKSFWKGGEEICAVDVVLDIMHDDPEEREDRDDDDTMLAANAGAACGTHASWRGDKTARRYNVLRSIGHTMRRAHGRRAPDTSLT